MKDRNLKNVSPEVLEENRRIRRLRLMMDLTIQLLYQKENLNLTEAFAYIEAARNYAISLFPGKGPVFDLIYKPRLVRVLVERGILKLPPN